MSCCPAMLWCAVHVFEDTIGKGKKRMNASYLCYLYRAWPINNLVDDPALRRETHNTSISFHFISFHFIPIRLHILACLLSLSFLSTNVVLTNPFLPPSHYPQPALPYPSDPTLLL
jgi:hypothetical protein